jgi:hypothetical protein
MFAGGVPSGLGNVYILRARTSEVDDISALGCRALLSGWSGGGVRPVGFAGDESYEWRSDSRGGDFSGDECDGFSDADAPGYGGVRQRAA